MSQYRESEGCGCKTLGLALLIAVVAAIVWVAGPWVMKFLYDVFVINITAWVVFMVGTGIIRLLLPKRWYDETEISILTVAFVVLVGMSAGVGFVSQELAKQYFVLSIPTTYTSLSEQLPDTTSVRYVPLPIAETFLRTRTQSSTAHIGDVDPLQENGEIGYIAPLIPTGFFNQLLGQMEGFSNLGNDLNLSTDGNQKMECGEEMYFRKNVMFWLQARNLTASIPELYYIPVEGKYMGVAPYILYTYQFPSVYETWGGVYVIHGDCTIEDLSPSQAMADPRFVGQRIYPEVLARNTVDNWGYRESIFNAWFWHKDEVENPTVPGENQMPYLIPSGNTVHWVTAAEPYGRTATGLYKLFMHDAHTGELLLTEFDQSSEVAGPVSAISYAEGAYPDFNFQHELSMGDQTSLIGNMIAFEPRPLLKHGKLFYLVTISNTDFIGIACSVIVDGANVREYHSAAEVMSFLEGTYNGTTPSEDTCRIAGANEPLLTTVPSQSAEPIVVPGNLSELQTLSTQQLLALMRQVVEELDRRDEAK